MTKKDIKRFIDMVKTHLRIIWNNEVNVAGKCSGSYSGIGIITLYVPKNWKDKQKVKKVLLHEIAHGLDKKFPYRSPDSEIFADCIAWSLIYGPNFNISLVSHKNWGENYYEHGKKYTKRDIRKYANNYINKNFELFLAIDEWAAKYIDNLIGD